MKALHSMTLLMALPMLNNVYAQERRPNILFAFGDDFGRYASIYAQIESDNEICKLISTPNFDRIAEEGILFRNAHVPAPSSTPCRSSILSGQYFWRTGYGAILQGAEWDLSIPSFPLLLQQDGYHVGFTYKVWSPGLNPNAPYGGSKNQYQAHGNRFCRFSQNVSAAPASQMEAAKQKLYDEVAGNFEDFLAARPDDAPFCYWWGPTNTHREWEKGSGKNIWGINPDDLKGILPACLPDEAAIREDFADYLGEVQAFDQGLGVLLDILERRGELDNTIIVVSGDHGIPGFPRAKTNLYNLGTTVAMAIRYPGTIAGGRVAEDVVNLMDLCPTFLDFAGTDIPEVMTGQSLKPLLESGKSGQIDPQRTFAVTGRERHVATAREGRLPYPMRGVVTADYKYIRNFEPSRMPVGTYETNFKDLDKGPTKDWYMANYFQKRYAYYMQLAFEKRPYEELYDLRNDPWEVKNLAEDPHYKQVLQELSAKLDSVLVTTNDPRMQKGRCIFDTPVFTDR